MNDIEKTKAMEQIKEISQDVDTQTKELMVARHARELAKLIENGSQEDIRICAEALVRKDPETVMQALMDRVIYLDETVKYFKRMAKEI